MESLFSNTAFTAALGQLCQVPLNPRRHLAHHALEHTDAVAAHAARLARLNGCSDEEARLLENLGLAHDIGKVNGSARPEHSLVVLRECGICDPTLLALVKWHDTSLPWWIAHAKGQPPSDKAWRRLATEVDLRLLALFMVADRIDAPAGWRKNAPTTWFLEEAQRRRLVGDLALDVHDVPSEVGVAVVLVRNADSSREALLIRADTNEYTLPTRDIEWDELPSEAVARAAILATGTESPLDVRDELGFIDHLAASGKTSHTKRVRYFTLFGVGELSISPASARIQEHKWVRMEDVATVPLTNEAVRTLLSAALMQNGGTTW